VSAQSSWPGPVRVSDRNYTRGCHWIHACSLECPLEATLRVTNGIPLGSSLLLPVSTVNSVQTRKVSGTAGRRSNRRHAFRCIFVQYLSFSVYIRTVLVLFGDGIVAVCEFYIGCHACCLDLRQNRLMFCSGMVFDCMQTSSSVQCLGMVLDRIIITTLKACSEVASDNVSCTVLSAPWILPLTPSRPLPCHTDNVSCALALFLVINFAPGSRMITAINHAIPRKATMLNTVTNPEALLYDNTEG
jgi:hypothetical protein